MGGTSDATGSEGECREHVRRPASAAAHDCGDDHADSSAATCDLGEAEHRDLLPSAGTRSDTSAAHAAAEARVVDTLAAMPRGGG